ncbi:beta-ketoacyl synthase N-terminal-like domain-containing protein [Streptomyces sp. MS1.AVA.1]|uniref:Beta-ketoacyl synthase N-terminal-like domain-containing protein n=1 Tax=Streptomyces machairae TaxID=3134109 RepID=A0ABU8UFW1_9ACTN
MRPGVKAVGDAGRRTVRADWAGPGPVSGVRPPDHLGARRRGLRRGAHAGGDRGFHPGGSGRSAGRRHRHHLHGLPPPGRRRRPEALWRLLGTGEDAITEVPAGRWDTQGLHDPDPEATGKAYSLRGGYLAGIDRFDAPFFGISPARPRPWTPSSGCSCRPAGRRSSAPGSSRTR